MAMDANMQVWLDTQHNVGQILVIPYVKTIKDGLVDYRMNVLQKGAAGTSRITQEGRVNAVASQPTPLARFALTRQKNGECHLELTLQEAAGNSQTYQFDCSPQE